MSGAVWVPLGLGRAERIGSSKVPALRLAVDADQRGQRTSSGICDPVDRRTFQSVI